MVRASVLVLGAAAFAACGDSVEPLPSPFTAVSAGLLHSCGLVGDGAAYCWGFNENGQLGDGSRRDRTTPVPVLGSLRFKSLSPGGAHTCGVTTANAVYCWGFNLNGQLGDGTFADRATPGPIAGTVQLVAVSAGGSYSCGLTNAGAAFCWGWNEYGQLGQGNTDDESEPVAVSGGLAFIEVSTGAHHTCGLTLAGAVHCWGRNDWGQLGNGTTTDSTVPVQVSGGVTFTDVQAGFQHTCAVALDGTAYCWGRNNFGQLGLGEGANPRELSPTAVPTGPKFSSISAGGYFTCGLEQGTGAAYCWGYNGSGQLGDNVSGECQDDVGNIFQCAFEPNPVSGGLTFQTISAATQHVCALSTQGVGYCWGLGTHGQLGDGSKGDQVFSIEPVRIAGQP